MATTTSSRDSRRRRIVDGGSDRLALITGRIQTLPSSSSQESHLSHISSCPPSMFNNQHFSDTDQRSSDFPQSENKDFSPLLPKHDSGTESGQLNNDDGRIRAEPFMRKCETTRIGPSKASALELDGKVKSSPLSSTVQNSSSFSTPNAANHIEPQPHHRNKIFTPSQISSAIAASERVRIYCSIAAAILVVLSYVGFPILGSLVIKSILLSRPLYLVLLTNVSIVLAQLLLEKQGVERANEQEASSAPLEGGFGLANQVGKALESGLVLQNIVGALFMDCSVYTIVVICGLSLAQRLGW